MTSLFFFALRILLISCVAGSLFLRSPLPVYCEEPTPPPKSEEALPGAPSLADLVHQAGAMGQRLEELKTRINTADELPKLEQHLDLAKNRIDLFHNRLGSINADDLHSYQQLSALKGEIRRETDAIARSVKALTEAIQKVEYWRQEWTGEKKQWEQWRSDLEEDLTIKLVAEAFHRAEVDTRQAIEIISEKLNPMLALQQLAGDIEAKIRNLSERIHTMMARQRGDTLRGGMPKMFSSAYLRELIELSQEPARLIKSLPPPETAFFINKGWLITLQGLFFLLLVAVVQRYRVHLPQNKIRRFLVRRPLSLSLFVTIFSLSFLYGSPPTLWRMLIQTLAGVVTARIAAAFFEEPWIKRAIYILILVMVGFQALLILGVPLAVVRLFTMIWSVAGILYFGWRAREGKSQNQPAARVWLLWLVVLVFMVIAVADLIGFGNFAIQVMDGAIRTAILLLMGWTMHRLVLVALTLGVDFLPTDQIAFLNHNVDAILRRVIFLTNILIVVFVAANLLVAWKLYAIPMEALQAFFSFGVTFGSQRITIGLVVTSLFILYGAFVLSWGIESLLMKNVLSRRQMDEGARISIVRLVHYALVLVGFLIALSALGFELKNVTIIGGALGVGIGFGLQAIVNNFVSGLILLFERPVKVGDVIQLSDGQQGRVMNLGLRATTVKTFDLAEIVVPNSDLVTSQVTNWTLADRSMRVIIPVGVAYGSDVEKVMRVLMAVATENDKVLKDPQPMVLFLNFGNSSLDFQLRAWIADFNDRRIIQSNLIQEIDRRFRAEGIEIPFPQQDLHLRSVDDKAAEQLKDKPNTSKERFTPSNASVPESE